MENLAGQQWKDFTTVRANYVLVNRRFTDDREYLEPLILRGGVHAQEVFSEAHFHLYEIR